MAKYIQAVSQAGENPKLNDTLETLKPYALLDWVLRDFSAERCFSTRIDGGAPTEVEMSVGARPVATGLAQQTQLQLKPSEAQKRI